MGKQGEEAKMIYLGTSGFKYDEWRGSFYPPELSPRDWLNFYCHRFNALEINSSYYRLLHPATYYHLGRKVPSGFLFTVKAYRGLTHQIGPQMKEELKAFLESISPLREAGKLGCVVAQFPTSFHRSPAALSHLELIRDGCADIPLAVEFRHRSWATQETFDFLRLHRLGFVCVDEPAFPNLMPPLAVATADFAYIRFHGRNYQRWWESGEEKLRYDYLYSEAELEEWMPRIEALSAHTHRVFIFMNNHFGGKAAINAQMLAGLIEAKLPGSIPSPPGACQSQSLQGDLPLGLSSSPP